MTVAEKNDHYGTLNARFDDRAGVLLGMGFKYTHAPEHDTAMFVRKPAWHRKAQTLTAAFVMHADGIVWQDRIEELAR